MRLFLWAFLFHPFLQLQAQVYKYWMHDTSIYLITPVSEDQNTFNDTIYAFKKRHELDTIRTGTIITYWDKQLTKKYESISYRNGKSTDTAHITWYPDGKMKSYMELNGSWKFRFAEWYPDGNIKVKNSFSGDTITFCYYYHSGKLKEKKVQMQERYLFNEKFCENGNVVFRDSLPTIEPKTFTVYWCNGKKKMEHTINYANFFGTQTYWYENGKVKEVRQYNEAKDLKEDDLTKYGASKPQGTWKYYNESGKLIRTVKYKDGKILQETNY